MTSIMSKLSKLLFTIMIMTIVFLPLTQNNANAEAALISEGKSVQALDSEIGHGPEYAVDSDAGNNGYWSSVIGDQRKNTWWQIDLGSPHHVSSIVIRNYVDGTRFYHYYIRGSLDGVHWTPIAIKGSNSIATDAGDSYSVSVAARYIRVNYTLGSAYSIAHMTDFKAYGHPVNSMSESPKIVMESATLDKASYQANEGIKLSYKIKNTSQIHSYNITNVTAKIMGLTSPYHILYEKQVGSNITLMPGEVFNGQNTPIWTIPNNFTKGSYALYMKYEFSDGSAWESYYTFFRIGSSSEKYVFTIDKELYNGLPVYKLEGDMSAGVAIEKAGESLGAGTSQMWNTTGGMLTSIHATPSFLVDSVQQTVDFYNEEFGRYSNFDTVLIGTGSFGTPYLSRALKAPFLPSHFLVSADTVQEIKNIHDYSISQGLSVYSMYGADASVNEGVAWIELLDLPPAYLSFLRDHNVKNIVFIGAVGDGGESLVRKVLTAGAQPGTTSNGDIYFGFNFAGVSEIQNLVNMNYKVKDFNDYKLTDSQRLKDWESGILQQQIDNYKASAVSSVPSLVAIDSVTRNLWEIAPHAMLSFFQKNNLPIQGVAINPYMNTHPFYESYTGYLPFLMLQWGTNVNQLIDSDLNVKFRAMVAHYFPAVDFDNMNFWVNFTRNAGNNDIPSGSNLWLSEQIRNRLIYNSLASITLNADDKNVNEVWNLSDGINSPCEVIAHNLTTYSSALNLKNWNDSMEALTLEELELISTTDPGIVIVQNYRK